MVGGEFTIDSGREGAVDDVWLVAWFPGTGRRTLDAPEREAEMSWRDAEGGVRSIVRVKVTWHRREQMQSPLMRFLQRWLINTVAVMVAANVLPGIRYESLGGLLVAALLLGVLNALVRPLLLLLSFPLVVLTLGLFTLIINALMLYFVGQLVTSFHVDTFWSAFWGGLLISIVTLILNTLTGSGEQRIDLRTPSARPGPPRDPPGKGPIIDV